MTLGDLAESSQVQDVPFLSEEIDYDEGFEDEDFDHHAAIEVTVPEGLKEGDLFIALVGDEEFEVIVPRGFRGGDVLDLAAEDGIFDVPDEPNSQAPADHAEAQRSKNPKAPRRQVSFTEEEPSVMLFRPELGGLGLDSENSEQFDQIEDSPPLQVLDIVIPKNVVAGDVLEVESADGETLEVVVPEGMEAGMKLTVESPKGKPAQLQFEAEIPLDHDQTKQVEAVQDGKEKGKDSVATAEQSEPPPLLEFAIPENASAGDVLHVESADGETVEVVVPEGMEAGMKLTVESPKGKPAQLQFEAEIPLDHDQAKQVEAVKDENEKGKDAVATAEQSEPPPLLAFAIPENASAGDVLHVESADGETVEVVVPEGMEAGMKLTVESPKGKPAQLQFEAEIPLDHDQAKQVEAVKDENEKGKDAVATAEQSEPPPLLAFAIPENASAGDVLHVESADGETVEVVVPEGMEAGMKLTVESPKGKPAQLQFEAEIPLDHDQAKQVGAVKDEKEKGKDAVATAEQSEAPPLLEFAIPENASAGDVLHVESADGETVEVVVPEGMEAGMKLTVESPKGKPAQLQFEAEIPLDHDQTKQVEAVQDGKEKGKDSVATAEQSEAPPLLEFAIPENASAGDVLHVESADGETVEVVVPEGMEAGMKLTVESPKGKPAQLQFEAEIPLDHDQAKQVGAVKDEKEKGKDAVATAEQSESSVPIEVVIPEGVSGGDILQVESDTGETVEVVVPEGVEAGMMLTIDAQLIALNELLSQNSSSLQPSSQVNKESEHLSTIQDILPETAPRKTILSEVEMDAILKPVSGNLVEKPVLPHSDAQRKVAMPLEKDERAESNTTGGAQWKTLAEYGGGEVMKLRRWSDSGSVSAIDAGQVIEDVPPDSGKVPRKQLSYNKKTLYVFLFRKF